jgi:hypothetical protein
LNLDFRLNACADLFDVPDDLVSGNEWQLRIRKFAIDDVKVGAANRTSGNTNEQLSRAQLRFWRVTRAKRLPWFFENHRAHIDLITMPVQNPKSETNSKLENSLCLRRIEILRDFWRFGFCQSGFDSDFDFRTTKMHSVYGLLLSILCDRRFA